VYWLVLIKSIIIFKLFNLKTGLSSLIIQRLINVSGILILPVRILIQNALKNILQNTMRHSFLNPTVIIFLLIIFISGCDTKNQAAYPFTFAGETEGTTFHIKAGKLPANLTVAQLQTQIRALLDKVDGQMSTYKKDSELSRFNQNPSTNWQPVSAELFTVIKEAQKISEFSQGAFDITVGGLVNLWGFGPEPIKFTAPADALIKERLAKVGYKQLSLQENPLAIKKAVPDLYVDLSAIAKGYAVDQVGLLLEHTGITDYMVEIGGEIRVKGKNSSGQAWQIAIEKPTPNKIMVERIISLTDIGMATSGDYRNFFEVDGVRFSHTLNPRTGRPISHKLASISVLSATTMEADALATALNVLGPDEGFQLAEQHKIAALFIVKAQQGFEEKPTSAFLTYVQEKK
jgi:thiamine biosynthesis lipoprotein